MNIYINNNYINSVHGGSLAATVILSREEIS